MNYLLPITEPATLNWNHYFIWKAKAEGIFPKNKLQQKWEQNESPITCEQNMIGEMEKEKNTRASKRSSNIAT